MCNTDSSRDKVLYNMTKCIYFVNQLIAHKLTGLRYEANAKNNKSDSSLSQE